MVNISKITYFLPANRGKNRQMNFSTQFWHRVTTTNKDTLSAGTLHHSHLLNLHPVPWGWPRVNVPHRATHGTPAGNIGRVRDHSPEVTKGHPQIPRGLLQVKWLRAKLWDKRTLHSFLGFLAHSIKQVHFGVRLAKHWEMGKHRKFMPPGPPLGEWGDPNKQGSYQVNKVIPICANGTISRGAGGGGHIRKGLSTNEPSTKQRQTHRHRADSWLPRGSGGGPGSWGSEMQTITCRMDKQWGPAV